MPKISKYTAVLVSFILFFCTAAWAQDDENQQEESQRMFQGLWLEFDLFSAGMSAFNRETFSFEGNIRVNLGERFFPIVELGFAGANKTSIHDFHFSTRGVFMRVGLDYNLLQPNTPETRIRRYFFVGGRYGISPFSYDITNIEINNEPWSDDVFRDFLGITTTRHWFEAVAGLRAEVLDNIYMGWSVRLRMQPGRNRMGEIHPWFIPGIGIQSVGTWGFSYTIGYRF